MKKFIAMLLVTAMSFATVTTYALPQAKTTTHTKKDGTPDKRYKENKTSPTVHTKKDGTPDKRYKENKTPKKP